MAEYKQILPCIIAENEYGKYCVPFSSAHRSAAQKILDGQVHEPELIKFMISNSGSGDIVHAGAYFGDMIPALSRVFDHVQTFEPNRENYQCALTTLEINNLTNVNLKEAGLGDRNETAEMLTYDWNGRSLGGGSKIANSVEYSAQRLEEVPIFRLDDVIPERDILIIHLDVEGYERQALEGAMETIRRCSPILILETVPESDWLLKNIYPLGYMFDDIINGNTIFRRGKQEV